MLDDMRLFNCNRSTKKRLVLQQEVVNLRKCRKRVLLLLHNFLLYYLLLTGFQLNFLPHLHHKIPLILHDTAVMKAYLNLLFFVGLRLSIVLVVKVRLFWHN